MIAFIKGKVLAVNENSLIVENNGLGYEVYIAKNIICTFKVGAETSLFTHLQVREDNISLYGFLTNEEKSMFLKLISISGVGPKVAITILGQIEPSKLAYAIINGDILGLSGIKGIGKKTAERIILELKGKFDLITSAISFEEREQQSSTIEEDAILALESLGLSKQMATKAVMAVKGNSNKLDELISLALKTLNHSK